MTEPIERRALAGTRLDTSVLGVSLAFGPRPFPDEDRAARTALGKFFAEGFTTFDLTSAPSLARASRLLLSTVTERDDRVVFLVGVPGRASAAWTEAGARLPSRTSPTRRGEFPGPPMEILRALSARGSVVIDWDPDIGTPEDVDSTTRWLDELEAESLIVGRAHHIPPQRLPLIQSAPATLGPLISSELSLLDPLAVESLSTLFSHRPGSVLVHDPFAGGLLDGSRFSRGLGDRAQPAPPTDVRALRREYEPVLRLEPLTRNHRRTLAQAALYYLLRWKWTAAVMIPLAAANRREEFRTALFLDRECDSDLESLGLIPRSDASGPSSSLPSG